MKKDEQKKRKWQVLLTLIHVFILTLESMIVKGIVGKGNTPKVFFFKYDLMMLWWQGYFLVFRKHMLACYLWLEVTTSPTTGVLWKKRLSCPKTDGYIILLNVCIIKWNKWVEYNVLLSLSYHLLHVSVLWVF